MSVALRLALPFWGGMVWLMIAMIPYLNHNTNSTMNKIWFSTIWIGVSLLISFMEFYGFFVRLLEIL